MNPSRLCILITTPHPCRRNNFFLKDFLDRATGRQGPAVFARLEAVEKRLEVSKMLNPREDRQCLVDTLYYVAPLMLGHPCSEGKDDAEARNRVGSPP